MQAWQSYALAIESEKRALKNAIFIRHGVHASRQSFDRLTQDIARYASERGLRYDETLTQAIRLLHGGETFNDVREMFGVQR